MSDLDNTLSKLTQLSFRARVLLDGNESGVAISYSKPDVMEISGLDPGFRLEQGSVRVYNGHQWQRMEDGQWLNILRLMDPRVYVDRIEERLRKTLPDGLYEVSGSCSVQNIGYGLTDDYIGWLKERNALQREITFRFTQALDLIEFEQSNLPPFQSERVTIRIDR